jgi:hypothetical protein
MPQDGLPQRMVCPLFDRSSRRQHGIRRRVVGDHHVDDFRPTDGKRSGLVEDNDVEFGRILQGRSVLEQDAVGCAQIGADHHGHRRRQHKGVRAGDDEDRDHQRHRK